jgi:hypothetical protein
MNNAVSVQLAGLTLADGMALDTVLDGSSFAGNRGSLNVVNGGAYYYIYLHVGTGNCGNGT